MSVQSSGPGSGCIVCSRSKCASCCARFGVRPEAARVEIVKSLTRAPIALCLPARTGQLKHHRAKEPAGQRRGFRAA